ncbi:cell wall hydrolase [Mesobacillus maritimus]|uniref:cell wall hydrolase n=1 Tax=Mesobacillus maritimus TaxID=1643336 RepID=UPI002040DFEB|nr:cell wall hydrolase [Mesobacillus maritimus]MCM3588816.1 cell wall hydrolase [Mesobacillus maritimus]
MKKLFSVVTLLATFFIASPAFAYTVQKGDTMSKIAHDNGITLQELAEANPHINNLDKIYVGDTVHMDKKQTANKASESLKVSNADKKTKTVKAPETKLASKQSPEINFSKDEIDLLARIVRAEAQTEPFQGKVAVAEVVLNRVESSHFPDTVRNVIYAPGQFQPVSNGAINKPADDESIKAVYTALSDQKDITNDAVFFYNPSIATNRWLDSRQTTAVIGQHVFKN